MGILGGFYLYFTILILLILAGISGTFIVLIKRWINQSAIHATQQFEEFEKRLTFVELSKMEAVQQTLQEEPETYFDSNNERLQADLTSALLNGDRLFLSGGAGTGKTWMIKAIADQLISHHKNVFVAASTGIAAVQVRDQAGLRPNVYLRGLRTVHSVFGIPPSNKDDTPADIQRGRERLQNCDVIIIDEISMTDRIIFDRLIQRIDGRPIGILVIGDFFQLPPVPDNRKDPVDNLFAFNSEFFSAFKLANLERIHRQHDPDFVRFLRHLRIGDCNWSFVDQFSTEFEERAPLIVGTNDEVAAKNATEINQIPGELIYSHASLENYIHVKPKDIWAWFQNQTNAEKHLKYKKGMRILWIKNIGEIVNGDMGTITNINQTERTVTILFDRPALGEKTVDRYAFCYEREDASSGEIKVQWKVLQFPFVPAYALTVHKAQGMTVDILNVDGSRVDFVPGHVYVAFSRVRTLSGLRVKNVSGMKAFASPRVAEFYRTIPRFEIPIN